jgi:hypothetical protein
VAIDLPGARSDAVGPADLGTETVKPAQSEIWRALNRIGQSRTMMRAERLIQLLNFLVETTLGGNARYLKETTIGVSVFGRSPDYDPKTDTIVRSQAWRLRAKLREYYATEGADDPVVIDIAKGQYSATFSFRPPGALEHPATSTEQRPHGSRR